MAGLSSMTGFASARGEHGPYSWAWELRSVNAKGLDLRLRLPDWIEGLEQEIRKALCARLGRGNISLSLRIQNRGSEGQPVLNAAMLSTYLGLIAQVEGAAAQSGVAIAPVKAVDLLGLRGVVDAEAPDADTTDLKAALLSQFPNILSALVDMRAGEGRALEAVLEGQLNTVGDLVHKASDLTQTRQADVARAFKDALTKVMNLSDGVDDARVAQELAVIAVKQDITEEIDRLKAHVSAARALLDKGGPVGRKLDFLMQEFNREANTLCSKSQYSALTTIGLDLKAVIDQMREQVQNVE